MQSIRGHPRPEDARNDNQRLVCMPLLCVLSFVCRAFDFSSDSFLIVMSGVALKRKLPALKEAGVNALNISLDTMEVKPHTI